MTRANSARPPTPPAFPWRWVGVRRRYGRFRQSELFGLLLLAAFAAAGAFWLEESSDAPFAVLIVPMVIGSYLLSPRSLPWLVLFSMVLLAVLAVSVPGDLSREATASVAIVVLVGILVLAASWWRSRLGVAGLRGESMLVDLRDRIAKQGELPALPPAWYAESVTRSAGGTPFAGDFMVAAKSRDGHLLQVAVVDVSGKGAQAGTRSLLLSGAFGGLLGAMPPEGFLPAANEYLLRQDWSEGFATAVHLLLHLPSGDFELRSAGHPPAVQLNSGSGRWSVHQAEGPVLGLLSNADFTCVRGRLQRGDALLLYTDGLVETPTRDISLGIDKLVGQGERLFRAGFENGARRLIDTLESRSDDRALLLLHRR